MFLKKSSSLFYKKFSHIYVEKSIAEKPYVKDILSRFDTSRIISINHYKDVFNRPGQSFAAQKQAQALILAENKGERVYRGAPFCQSFGNDEFYYTSFMLNCLYDCEYCYLRGMYPSGNIVVFVNLDDYFKDVKRISENKEIFLCVSYDTDLLAFEKLLGLCGRWYDFAAENPNVKIELRTKCSDISFLEEKKPLNNFILAFTISPKETAERYEKFAPSLASRLKAVKKAADLGFRVRLSFDPILITDNFEETYDEFIRDCFSYVSPEKITDIGLGGFRISPKYLKAARKEYPSSLILNYPFEKKDGICAYDYGLEKYMTDYAAECIKKYAPGLNLYLWTT